MGIDPGTNFTGYGFLSVRGKDPVFLELGSISLGKEKDMYQKLRAIFEEVSALIDRYRPDEVAFESPFFGENVQSMLKLGRAQGVAMAAALTKGLPVYEYAPRRIKLSITGKGAASKEQVAGLLSKILKVEFSADQKLDATDGLAVALCHFYQSTNPLTQAKTASWNDFISRNPDRIVK